MPKPIVQIFPMTDGYLSEDQSFEEFFQDDLPKKSSHRPVAGRFNFKSTGVAAPPGSLLLFQYDSAVRAHAELRSKHRRDADSPEDSMGFWLLDVPSVRLYKFPVTLAGLNRYWPEISALTNVRWKLDPSKRARFEKDVG